MLRAAGWATLDMGGPCVASDLAASWLALGPYVGKPDLTCTAPCCKLAVPDTAEVPANTHLPSSRSTGTPHNAWEIAVCQETLATALLTSRLPLVASSWMIHVTGATSACSWVPSSEMPHRPPDPVSSSAVLLWWRIGFRNPCRERSCGHELAALHVTPI